MRTYKTFAMVFAVVAIPLFGVSSVTAAQAAEGANKTENVGPQSETVFNLFRGTTKNEPEKTAAASQAKPAATKKQKAGNGRVVTTKRQSGRKKAVKAAPATSAYHGLVSQFAREYGVPADLAHAVVSIESNYYPKALGKAGEIGLMQIKPSTARGMGYRGPSSGLYHPETNIKYGMKYLATAYKLGGGTTCGAILKYNAGHGAKRMNPTSSAYCAKVKRILGK